MKKGILIGLIVLFVGGSLFTSCEVCTTCTESTTQGSADFCGKKSEVEDFEDVLVDTPGLDWKCTRD